MTEKTPPKPAIDINKVKNKLLQQKAEIARLGSEVTRLQEELAKNQTKQHRMMTEPQLTVDDSELAKSFNQKNYAPIIEALFDKPSRQLRNGAFVITLFVMAAALATGYFSSSYLSYTHNIIVGEKLDTLQDQLTSLIKQQQLQQDFTNKQTTLSELDMRNRLNSTVNIPPPTPIIVKNAPATHEKNDDIEIKNRIAEQADAIFRYVKTAEKKEGFLDDYINDKTQFAQLYLIVMQYSSNENIYYESYLEVIKSLGISADIAPKTIDDLLKIDMDFLQSAYSGLLITGHKRKRGWRYREEDRQFSSYYNNALKYNLGGWQIVNDSQDYKTLPNIFSLNIDRVTQQIIFNGRGNELQLPEQIYYSAYPEAKKNNALKKLLNQIKTPNNNGVLTINASIVNLPINNTLKKKLAERLIPNGFQLAGSSLTASINQYRASKGWKENSIISLELLHSLNLYPTYKDLQRL